MKKIIKKSKNNSNNFGRPYLLLANSSWYLFHYRKKLISKLNKDNHKIIALAPFDSSSKELSKLLTYIPWRIRRKDDLSLIALIISFIKLYLIIRMLKPKLVHSHTIRVNLISSAVCFLYGIPNVISFAGMGKISKKGFFNKLIFKKTLKLINFFSSRDRTDKFRWEKTDKRARYIFQNPNDLQLFEKNIKSSFIKKELILGSGVPLKYLSKKNQNIRNNFWVNSSVRDLQFNSLTFIFCGRLLYSKGIGTFLDLANIIPSAKFLVYGGRDESTNNSISLEKINEISKQNSNISFLGPVIDPLLLEKKSYPVLLVPSEYGEGLPRAILEAFSLKIPVLCSRTATCGIFKEKQVFISNEKNALSYKNLVEHMIQEYYDGSLSKRIDYNFKFVSNNFKESMVANKTIKLYEELQLKNNNYLLSKDIDLEKNWIAN